MTPDPAGLNHALLALDVPPSYAFGAAMMAPRMQTRELRVSVVACVLEGEPDAREVIAKRLLVAHGLLAEEGV